jgi:hypothetical protein
VTVSGTSKFKVKFQNTGNVRITGFVGEIVSGEKQKCNTGAAQVLEVQVNYHARTWLMTRGLQEHVVKHWQRLPSFVVSAARSCAQAAIEIAVLYQHGSVACISIEP